VTTLLGALRLQARSLAKAPSFAVTVLLTLAIGIGATAAVFSVVNSVLLKPLPYPDADELVAVWHVAPGAPGITDASGGLRSSPSMYYRYSEESQVFQSIGLWSVGAATVTGLAEPEEVGTVAATPGLLETLRVSPLLGRWLAGDDFVPNGPNRVVLAHDYWQTRFGGDSAVLGRNVTVNGVPAEIVGVMPPGFRVLDAAPGLIVPIRFDRAQVISNGPGYSFRGIARLKPSTTIEQANADAKRVLDIWFDTVGGGREFFQAVWQIAPALRPLKQDVVGNVGSVLWVVFGTIGIVLLIACANVMNLLLVRAQGRERELAVRAALGAGAWRIARQLLFETVSLAALGGVLGLVFAYGALGLLRRFGPATLPRLHEIALDWQSVALAFAVALLAGVVLGAVPALKVTGQRVVAGLQGGARGASGGRRQYRAQSAFVVVQVALALVLLVSSGLMIRTFQALLVVDPGFANASELQTVRLSIPVAVERDPARVLRMQNDIVDALAAIPGVSSAAFVTAMPLEGRDADWDVLLVQGAPPLVNANEAPIRRFHYTSPGMLRTAGTRLIAGRDIEWTDVYEDRPVAMVSENLARELWGSAEAALGKRVAPALSAEQGRVWREVVGVVQTVRDNGLSEPEPTIVYWPSFIRGFYSVDSVNVRRAMTFVMRSSLAGTEALTAQMQQAVWSVNRDLPLASVRTMKEIYDESLARPSFTLVMLAAAAAAALVLGIVGLYGVLTYVIAQRRREIAIRLALGAQQSEVTRRFVRYGVVLAGIGIVLGLGAAIGVTRLMSSLLFGVRPVDALTYGAVGVSLAVVAAIASWLPARRASAVDPAESLAAE
jgi:putative ABC transport system permease protein